MILGRKKTQKKSNDTGTEKTASHEEKRRTKHKTPTGVGVKDKRKIVVNW